MVTHVVYALNDYGLHRLRPSWLPQEFAFLKKHLRQSIADDDPETTGEFLDTLKAFGPTQADPVIRAGMDFVLSRQHVDGSWGAPGDDCYTPYHATWTAIGGLMDYAFRGERTRYTEALRRAQGRQGCPSFRVVSRGLETWSIRARTPSGFPAHELRHSEPLHHASRDRGHLRRGDIDALDRDGGRHGHSGARRQCLRCRLRDGVHAAGDRKSTRLNSSHT